MKSNRETEVIKPAENDTSRAKVDPVDADSTNQPVENIDDEQLYRASAYALLAALLRGAPDTAMLEHLSGLSESSEDSGDELMQAMSALALAAQNYHPDNIATEYHQLFIGLGKGEVVPYGSWYVTGFLMEQPLSDLRDDLASLGFERNSDIVEPEDHVAALFEVVSIMISDGTELSNQYRFLQSHVADWVVRFFDDLGAASSAEFYKPVARFGAAFMALEKQYLSMQV